MSEIKGHGRVKLRVTGKQKQMIEKFGTNNKIFVIKSQHRKFTVIWKHPSNITSQLAFLLLSCLVNFKIEPVLFRYKFYNIITALLDLGCEPRLESYINEFIVSELRINLQEICIGLTH